MVLGRHEVVVSSSSFQLSSVRLHPEQRGVIVIDKWVLCLILQLFLSYDIWLFCEGKLDHWVFGTGRLDSSNFDVLDIGEPNIIAFIFQKVDFHSDNFNVSYLLQVVSHFITLQIAVLRPSLLLQ